MLSVTDFLAVLPGIRPRLARKVVLEGGLLSTAERADIRLRDDWYGTTWEIGPDPAAAVLAAYLAGRLPMTPDAVPEPAPEAESYLAQRRELVAERDTRLRRESALRDVALAQEQDFEDHRFLDKLFHAHAGKGARNLVLDGIEVNKTLVRYPSNSGKSNGWAVRFDWTGRDGIKRSSSVEPPEASNRRNDPARDWGLPD